MLPTESLAQNCTMTVPFGWPAHWALKSPVNPTKVEFVVPFSEYHVAFKLPSAMAREKVGVALPHNCQKVGVLMLIAGGTMSLRIVMFAVPTLPAESLAQNCTMT